MRFLSARPPLLGELEAAVMEHVWSMGASDVKTTHAAVRRRRRITLNTVQSTMERLYRKGLLDRRKVSHAYVYSPRVSREELVARIVSEVMAQLGDGRPESMLSAFVDVAERAGAEQLERLERLIAARKGRKA